MHEKQNKLTFFAASDLNNILLQFMALTYLLSNFDKMRLMEFTSDDNSSDKDRKMMNNFETFSDKEDSKEKKKKAKDKRPSPFELAADGKKPEKDEGIFAKKPEEKAEKKEELKEEDLEKLTAEEAKTVTEKFVEARAEDLKQELNDSEPDSLQEAEALTDAAFIEAVSEKLPEDNPIDDETLDEVLAETLEELEIEPELIVETDRKAIGEDVEENTDEADSPAPPDAPLPSRSPTRPSGSPPIPPTPPVIGRPAAGPIASNLPSPNLNSAPQSEINERYYARRRGADLLVGGVIGYLIGRRRGRIKTEARLLPVQEKLEKEVKDLHEKISAREDKIRKLVANKIESRPEDQKPLIIEKLTKKIEQRATNKIETQNIVEPEPELAEKLGRVLLPRPETAKLPERKENVAQLAMPELLEMASKIKVEGISARTMYESQRIDAVALRRVVEEYMRGGNYERMLHDAILARESIEKISGQPGISGDSGFTGGGRTAQDSSPKATPAGLASMPAKPASLTTSNASGQNKTNDKKRQAVAGIAAATIVILIFIWLLMT